LLVPPHAYSDTLSLPGTLLRFVSRQESHASAASTCKLPGLVPVTAAYDQHTMPAYCDHWVSNVVSRTGFLDTLEDTLGFTPKVDFNAGVVAAGEAQIESTVTGNTSKADVNFSSALKDQSQVCDAQYMRPLYALEKRCPLITLTWHG